MHHANFVELAADITSVYVILLLEKLSCASPVFKSTSHHCMVSGCVTAVCWPTGEPSDQTGSVRLRNGKASGSGVRQRKALRPGSEPLQVNSVSGHFFSFLFFSSDYMSYSAFSFLTMSLSLLQSPFLSVSPPPPRTLAPLPLLPPLPRAGSCPWWFPWPGASMFIHFTELGQALDI